MSDPHDLQRFVDAQANTYEQALAELRAGEKRTHWLWFVFPQVAGLGRSGMAQRFAISGLEEARASSRSRIANRCAIPLRPSPSICGKTNHIQCVRFRPPRSSDSAWS